LTTYKVQNENAKLNNICIRTIAENQRSVQCEGKVSNQSVTNADCCDSCKMFWHFTSHFTRCRVRIFTVLHFAFYTHLRKQLLLLSSGFSKQNVHT